MYSLFLLQFLKQNEIDRDKAVSELQILAVDCSYGERAILKAIRNMQDYSEFWDKVFYSIQCSHIFYIY
jgi:hypothetical protein